MNSNGNLTARNMTTTESEQEEKKKKSDVRQIRAERLSSITERLGLKLVADGHSATLLNLSETGLAFETSRKIAAENQKLELRLLFDDERLIYDGPAIIAWEHTVPNGYRYGARFSSHILSEALPHALEAAGSLFAEIESLRTETEILPQEFKSFLLELKTYLEALKSRLDEMERRLLPNSSESKKSHRRAIELWVSPQVIDQLQKYNMRLFNMLSLFTTPEEKTAAISLFRREMNDLMLQAPFTERALVKPRGYAGDFELMNQIYRNEYEGGSLYAQIIHKYSISEASSRSVRYRKEMMVRRFNELLKHKPGGVNFASLACGPAREVIDFLKSADLATIARCSFALLDHDSEALLNCKRNLYQLVLERDLQCELLYCPISVKDILERSLALKQLDGRKFDLLYTAGLYDYLSQPLARALTNELTNHIKPGGSLVIGNFHPSNPTKAISEFLVDWKLIYRTGDEMMDLVPDSLKKNTKLYADDQDMDLFIEIVKP